MPKQIDHAARRRDVAQVAAALIAQGGLDAVTFRDVARASGCSTAIVSHYFADKRDLLIATYRSSSAGELVDAPLAADPTDLRGALAALLPLNEQRLQDWKVYVAFWGRAVADPELDQLQRDRVRASRRRLASVVRALRAAGRIDDAVSPEPTARRLLALVMGIAAQVVFDQDDWPVRRQLAVIDAELAQLGVRPRPASAVR